MMILPMCIIRKISISLSDKYDVIIKAYPPVSKIRPIINESKPIPHLDNVVVSSDLLNFFKCTMTFFE